MQQVVDEDAMDVEPAGQLWSLLCDAHGNAITILSVHHTCAF